MQTTNKGNIMNSTTQVDEKNRSIETRIETSIPGIFLELSTSHSPGAYSFRVNRVKIENKIAEYKIGRALFQDPAPINRTSSATPRYSKKQMIELHEAIMGSLSDERISEAIQWAERH